MKFTQRMMMHLNGGSEFSQLNYAIFADGKPTNLSRVTRTGGSPKYLKTVDVISDGQSEFDVLATRAVGMEEWLKSHVVVENA